MFKEFLDQAQKIEEDDDRNEMKNWSEKFNN